MKDLEKINFLNQEYISFCVFGLDILLFDREIWNAQRS